MSENRRKEEPLKVSWTGYVSLAFAVVFFSGALMNSGAPWSAFDFSTIVGKFGSLGTLTEGGGKLAANFRGTGGTGPRDAFLLALTLIPSIMFALGIVKVIENLDGVKAAQKILTPLMRLIFGLPGFCALALVAGLQNSDAAASMSKQLQDEKMITEKEKILFLSFHFPAPAIIVNYFALTAVVFPYLSLTVVKVATPLIVILLCKVIGANLFRFLILNRLSYEDDDSSKKTEKQGN